MEYKISEIAKLFGLPASTIRYYDNHHLLPFVKRNSAGDRVVDMADITTFNLICLLKQAGCSLNEISKIIDLAEKNKTNPDTQKESYADITALIDAHIDQLLLLQEQLINQQRISKYLHWYFATAEKEGSTKIFLQDDAPTYPGILPEDFIPNKESADFANEIFKSFNEKYLKGND